MRYADAMIQHGALKHVTVGTLTVDAAPEAEFPDAAREAIILGMLHWVNVELRHDGQTLVFRVNEMLLHGEVLKTDESSVLARGRGDLAAADVEE